MKRAGLILLLAVWLVLTRHRVEDWTSNLRLWRSAVRVTPCLPRVHANLSLALRPIDPIASSRELATAKAIAEEHQCVVLR